MGFFGKSMQDKLIDHAVPLLKDENKFEVYFKQFNGDGPIDKKQFLLFKEHWKAILVSIILDVYVTLGKERNVISTREFAFIRMQIMCANEIINSDAHDLVGIYMGKENWDKTLSDACFGGKLSKEVREDVVNTVVEIYQFFEKSVEQYI